MELSFKALMKEEDVKISLLENDQKNKTRYYSGLTYPNELPFRMIVIDKSTRRKKNVRLELSIGEDIKTAYFIEDQGEVVISSDFRKNDFTDILLRKIQGVTGIPFPTLDEVRGMIR